MEVSTVSPSPASPTEGDDLCETDVTTVAIHSVTLLICLCGLAGNGAVIGLLSLKSRNTGIFHLAVMDFFYLLFVLPSALLFLVEDVSCSPILPFMYLNFLLQLSMVSFYWGLFCLTPLSAVLLRCKLCKLRCLWELPERLRWVLESFQYCSFFPFLAVISTVTLLCPSHMEMYCNLVVLIMYVIPYTCIAVMVIFSSIIFTITMLDSCCKQCKRHNIVIVSIVPFTLIISLCNFLQQIGYTVLPSQVVFLLACIHSTIKPFIYFLLGRCWRPCSVQSLQLSLQRVFEEPEENTAHRNDPAMDTGV
ncbi:mas-related G-protein coupled receptor member H-like [Melospiza georgiana]|uniref:mas-related G-protein coupled receptor member H-like n=1 Tax=Melospiza georgiana TaxID=44398 RepID=UPI0025AB6D3F|nr:mas-related G-protein coupled receptor member H-like [Melospiza georgiana]